MADPHVCTIEGPLPYPGGKDGLYKAVCDQGDYVSSFSSKGFAERAGAQHETDKNAGLYALPPGAFGQLTFFGALEGKWQVQVNLLTGVDGVQFAAFLRDCAEQFERGDVRRVE